MIQYGLAVLMLCSSAWLESNHRSGKTQKVIYPNGRIVYEPVQPKPAPKPAPKQVVPPQKVIDAPKAPQPVPANSPQGTPSAPPLPCCGDGTNPPSGGDCQKYNPVQIVPGSDEHCKGTENCGPPLTVEKKGHLDEVRTPPIKFYKEPCSLFRAKTDIPVIMTHAQERLIFGRKRFGEECCQYEVCVVIQCCYIDTKKCVNQPKDVDMRACRRTVDNLIDVYVLGEPGFPEQWVLDLGITEDEFKAKYPGKTVP